MPAAPASRSKVHGLLLALLGVQIAWGAVRVPDKAIGRRRADIARYQELGAARYFLEHAKFTGWDEVAWLREHTAPDAVVLYEGPARGPLEFAPGLVAPRLLVATSACPVTATEYAGRPVARARRGATAGTVC
ncbi:MAG: hypothetical protein WBO45_11195, partial [Planctomycetota bacterium]